MGGTVETAIFIAIHVVPHVRATSVNKMIIIPVFLILLVISAIGYLL